MLACIMILTLYLAVPITLATAALFRPEIGAKKETCPCVRDDPTTHDYLVNRRHHTRASNPQCRTS